MDKDTSWLTFYYSRFKFEFKTEDVFITDLNNRTKYRMCLTRNPDHPFIYEVIEKDVEE